jgi:hypothetical protein
MLKEVLPMNEISIVAALIGLATATLNLIKAAIELISRARKGRSRKEGGE